MEQTLPVTSFVAYTSAKASLRKVTFISFIWQTWQNVMLSGKKKCTWSNTLIQARKCLGLYNLFIYLYRACSLLKLIKNTFVLLFLTVQCFYREKVTQDCSGQNSSCSSIPSSSFGAGFILEANHCNGKTHLPSVITRLSANKQNMNKPGAISDNTIL